MILRTMLLGGMALGGMALALSGCMINVHNPTGAPSSINDRFVSDDMQVDQWTQRFEGESREVYRARTQIVEIMAIPEGARIADVGTGTGLFVGYFSKAVGPKGKVLALDIAPKFVEHVAARAEKAGLTNVEARLSKVEDVDLPPRYVDIIFVCDTYHHFENVEAILESMRVALKPGGRLVIVDYHRIEGKTRPFLMEHVRADQATFAREITRAGFERLADPATPFLEENYMMVFRRP